MKPNLPLALAAVFVFALSLLACPAPEAPPSTDLRAAWAVYLGCVAARVDAVEAVAEALAAEVAAGKAVNMALDDVKRGDIPGPMLETLQAQAEAGVHTGLARMEVGGADLKVIAARAWVADELKALDLVGDTAVPCPANIAEYLERDEVP